MKKTMRNCVHKTVSTFGKEDHIMNNKEAVEVIKLGKKLVCPVCEYDKFWTRATLMNTRGASFFNFDWANKTAKNYICDQCGYVYWFLEK